MQTLLQWDHALLLWLNGFLPTSGFLAFIVTAAAVWLIYVLMIILIGAWFWPAPHRERHRLLLIRATLVGLFAWLMLTKPLGLWIDRSRPFESLEGVREFLFHRPDYSFPSDHATFLFALTLGFFLGGNKPLGWIFLIGGGLVMLARVISGIHYPGDILAGMLVATLAVLLLYPVRGFIDTYLGRTLVNLARALRLA